MKDGDYMGKCSSIRIIISFFCCVIIIVCGGYNYLFGFSATKRDDKNDKKDENNIISSIIEIAFPESEKQTPKTENTDTVSAASKGNVVGKVSEKFISPYTAKTSYNNVYLKNSTDLNVDLKSLLKADLGYKIEKNDEPQVLILHTHATETFLDSDRDYYTDKDVSRTTDQSKNMVAVGKIVADKLNTAGIKTIHDTTLHDYPSYNESYTRAAKTITGYLKKHPSIKIVIDLHRDAISPSSNEKVKVTAEIDGKKAAQIMLVMGSQSGNTKNFPNWQENLKLAVKLQQTVEVMYPSLARSISLMPKNYNESLTTGSMLIEMGTDANSLEEVKYSAELLGNALKSLLNTL